MRQVLNEKDDMKSLKSKQREKVRPKLGKMTIEYQKLHDAFFKWQTKPYMTIHGDLYYEGKEFETQLREKKPGEMSDELRQALSMPLGQDKHKCPPPWLIAMQRYGPPPSYPNLKIPGLNAPIPEGALFGYHLGGWGKPPVDEYGRALYGDVFGTQQQHMGEDKGDDEDIDKTLWGELESEDESTDESDDASEPEIAKPPLPEDPGIRTPAGFATPSGLTSIPRGIETPGSLELRKRTVEDGHEGGETPSLYTLIPEKQTSAGTFLTTHTYDLSGSVAGHSAKAPTPAMGSEEGVELMLDPSELDMEPSTLQAKYEQKLKDRDDDNSADVKKGKRKKSQTDTAKVGKKMKSFKF
eukprot:TRINITY_DN12502_c0_g2_i4.p1 TRINITY_DN12502_c0_g2~~TRINITY_DN12502_c0_g2_i4.p1  ORF type:complete len:354 (-),score=112.01 TRINITY_DN12502_c0_g2_i4:73-1134(-)